MTLNMQLHTILLYVCVLREGDQQ